MSTSPRLGSIAGAFPVEWAQTIAPTGSKNGQGRKDAGIPFGLAGGTLGWDRGWDRARLLGPVGNSLSQSLMIIQRIECPRISNFQFKISQVSWVVGHPTDSWECRCHANPRSAEGFCGRRFAIYGEPIACDFPAQALPPRNPFLGRAVAVILTATFAGR